MELYKALHLLYLMADHFSYAPKFYTQLGLSLGYHSNELILIAMFLKFNYKLAFYLILMGKYTELNSLEEFASQMKQIMVFHNLDFYYINILKQMKAVQYFWPDLNNLPWMTK